jgi:hypothetical protein
MSSSPTRPAVPSPGGRQALNDSEKKAAEKEPGSYKEAATNEKIVGIPPAGPDSKPIRGLDSK